MNQVEWVAGDPAVSDLSVQMGGAAAVVDCIGVIGGSDDEMVVRWQRCALFSPEE